MTGMDLATEIKMQNCRSADEISVEQLKMAVELSPAPILLLSPRSLDIVAANSAGKEFLRTSDCDWSGMSLFDYVPERKLSSFRATLALLERGEPIVVDISNDHGVGLRPFILRKVEDGIVAVDQTAYLAQSNADLNYSETDPLTGLRSRHMLDQCLNAAIDRKDYRWGALFIDLNDYKEVNDCLGHVIGDKVLVDFARKLQASARPMDLVFRFGGDEFVIVVNRIASEQLLRRVAERIALEVTVEVKESETTFVVTASIGCAMAWPELKLPEQIIDAADRDMYCAKRSLS